MIFIKIAGMGDPSITTEGYNDGSWFAANSFSFGVERELKSEGEKGGMVDINIGLGELQVCRIGKRLDLASTELAQFSVNGNSVGKVEIDFVEPGGGSAPPVVFLKYKFDRCFIASWSTFVDADERPMEEFGLRYNKIAFQYAQPRDTKSRDISSVMSWDAIRNVRWGSHGVLLRATLGRSNPRKRTTKKQPK